MAVNVIDRRLNPSGKSLPNRQRFIRLAKDTIKEAVVRSIRERSLGEIEDKEVVSIPMKRIAEPRLRHSSQGGKNPSWTSYEKIREVIEKRMFTQVEDLLPVISFTTKSDKDAEKKHNDFVERMVSRGYTARQTRRLVEWYMRVDKAG